VTLPSVKTTCTERRSSDGKTSKKPASRSKRKRRPLAFPLEFRLRVAKLYLEEGYSPKLLVEQFGISSHSIHRWVKVFRLHGAKGLEPKRPLPWKSRVLDNKRSWFFGFDNKRLIDDIDSGVWLDP
jgi:transposase-like protein